MEGYTRRGLMAVSDQPKPGGFSILVAREGETDVFRLVGELDQATAPRLEEALAGYDGADGGDLLLDLAALEFLDSTGLRVLLNAVREADGNGGRLRMRGASGQVERVLKITGVHSRFPFAD